jgi:hypothetical protein
MPGMSSLPGEEQHFLSAELSGRPGDEQLKVA